MSWTDREVKVWNEVLQWEEQFINIEATDFERTYKKLLNSSFEKLGKKRQTKVLETVDRLLFHLHAMIQHSRYHQDAKSRLIDQARVFNEEIEDVSDLKQLNMAQLNFIAQQQVAKQRLLSFGQGGLSGMGGVLLLGTDLPALFFINLRSVQLIAMTYGYDLKRPYEMMVALKVFHAASLPRELQKQAWDQLEAEVSEQTNRDTWFYEGDETVTELTWLQQPANQVLKAMLIVLLRKKLIQGVPLIGMAFGASMNYQFTRQVTEFAHRFYQKRFLLEKYE
ncbi:EcsC family protein [Desertibacillus haloalkaliphilus]|uniref:EcsC family protein n=1 Tax=Desertibacillus haloalkaliphilus TaxID=1328930 RepID=UPI001C267275|nr:EcsC family protein [Desertibacillus haloalkaliphilus]MBU8905182.1 EcsC family protein [Desertibacillus haloalkaliphilus]